MSCLRDRSLALGVASLLLAAPVSAGVTFTEVGESAGVRFVHDPLGFKTGDGTDIQNLYGPGVGIEDVNNDGWLDLFITNGAIGNRLFLNNGDWTFSDISVGMGVQLSRVANGVAFGDLDNDGLVDFTLGNFYAQPQLYMHRTNSFLDSAERLGLVPLIPADGSFVLDPESMGVAFADFNQDGFLDIYVANYRDQQDVLYRSLPGGSYWQYDDSVQVTYSGYGFQAVFLDFDDDGDLDIYVANDFGYNFMFRNLGAAQNFQFEEVALAHGIAGGGTSIHPKGMSMGLAVGDYDNDLDLDINITNFQLNSLYRNDGPGTRPGIWKWTEVAAQLGVEYPINCWGTDFVDLDHDTDLDLVQASGYIYEVRFQQPYANPDQVWLNDGPEAGYTFTNITEQSNFGSTEMARGLATGDLDRDGDVDVAIVNNTFYDPTYRPGATKYEGWSQLYRNDQDLGLNWLNLRLEGMRGRTQGAVSNRSAVGARVWVTTTAGLTMMREIQAGASFMSHNSLEVEFGLGTADVASVRVRWPGGSEQTWTDVHANRFWHLRELDPAARAISFAMTRFDASQESEGIRFTWSSAPSARVITARLERRTGGGEWTTVTELQGNEVGSGEVFDDAPPSTGVVDYRLVLVEDDGLETVSAVSTFDFGGDTPPLPTIASLGQNYPNPFNPSTNIEFELPRAQPATLRIFDTRGRLVRTLFEGQGVAGTNTVEWDGLNDEGEAAASGVYHYQLQTASRTESKRMVLTR